MRNVTEALLKLLAGESLSEPTARTVDIVYALGRVGDQNAAGPLLEALRKGNDALRATAAGALGDIRARNAFRQLRSLALDSAEDLNVRGNACIALGKLRSPKSREALEAVSAAGITPSPEADPVWRTSDEAFLARCMEAAMDLLECD